MAHAEVGAFRFFSVWYWGNGSNVDRIGLSPCAGNPAKWNDLAGLSRRKWGRQHVVCLCQPQLIQINTGFTGDFSLLLSNNANTGGTCFGDSGGPNFIGDSNVIARVTSFGMSGTCAGTGGVYGVGRVDDLDWLYAEFGDLLP